jgi:hypothetical protein
MEITTVKEMKKNLELAIREMVSDFESRSGMKIIQIDLNETTVIGQRHPKLHSVTVTVELV